MPLPHPGRPHDEVHFWIRLNPAHNEVRCSVQWDCKNPECEEEVHRQVLTDPAQIIKLLTKTAEDIHDVCLRPSGRA